MKTNFKKPLAINKGQIIRNFAISVLFITLVIASLYVLINSPA